MRLTDRDLKLVRDLAFSHVLSRDQILELGYFGSVTRVNTRLRELAQLEFIRVLETPFFAQRLYTAGRQAKGVLSDRISNLLKGREQTPRFLQHALATTNVRIALTRKKGANWKFEQELWRKLEGIEIRPDGLLLSDTPIFLEVDMGNVAPAKFREKLMAYDALASSNRCRSLYGFAQFRVLAITSGPLRAKHLHRLAPPESTFGFLTQTFADIGATPISSWS